VLPSTWIDNDVVENILLQTFSNFDIEFSKLFETQATSQEEVLTGFFVEKLSNHSVRAQGNIHSLLQTLGENWHFLLTYVDVSPAEKQYGADIAFVLRTNIPDKMRRKKVIFVQCKKMNPRPDAHSGFDFYPSWPIDRSQADDLCHHTQFGYYFLYGPHSQRIMTRVIPARSVIGIMDATTRKTTIPSYEAITTSRSFADFFLHDFIGCWTGDERNEAFEMAEGKNERFSVRYLVSLDISRGENLDRALLR
jgi:hypothetical protein